MQIGIDLGGTKIEAIALAAETVVAPRRRLAAPRDYGGTLDAIAALVAELERETGGRGTVGIGIPGVVTRATGRGQERQLRLAQRPPAPGGRRGAARPAGADGQRRQLLHPVRGDRRRGTAGARPSSASSSAPESAAGSRSGGGSSTGPNQVGRGVGSQPAALADRRGARRGAALLLRQDGAASRPGSRAPASSATPPARGPGAVRARGGAGRRRPATRCAVQALRRYRGPARPRPRRA